jgi:hypothetical protein
MEERESYRTCRTIQAIKPPKSFSLTIGKEMEKEKRKKKKSALDSANI